MLVGTNGRRQGSGSPANATPVTVMSAAVRVMPGAVREIPGLVVTRGTGVDGATMGDRLEVLIDPASAAARFYRPLQLTAARSA